MPQVAVEQATQAIDRYLDSNAFNTNENYLLRQQVIGRLLGIEHNTSLEEFRSRAVDTATTLFKVLDETPTLNTQDPKLLKAHIGRLRLILSKLDALISLADKAVNPVEGMNLTDIEVAVLEKGYNLADGHAYRPWTNKEAQIISRASTILEQVDRRERTKIEDEYFKLFFELGRQTYNPTKFDLHMCFTASTALEVIGNYLRLNHLSVSLIEPCFDNLADILKRHDVVMRVFEEDWCSAINESISTITTDAIFLVTPNNPTGKHITRDNLQSLAEFCQKNNKLLILDTCFRFYLPEEEIYDQYKILTESGVNFITVEDTGKTWPTLELKGPFMTVSKGVAKHIAHIYSDFLLHVSPFTVQLMSEFLRLSKEDRRASLHEVVNRNRSNLYANLVGTYLSPTELPFASVAWLRITNNLSAHSVRDTLSNNGVHVLTGHRFFWSDESKGDSYIRISLVRDPVMFAKAANIINQVCSDKIN